MIAEPVISTTPPAPSACVNTWGAKVIFFTDVPGDASDQATTTREQE